MDGDNVRDDRRDDRQDDRPDAVLRIDCDECRMAGSDACGDCLVTFIASREPDEAVVIDAGEARALRLLNDAGLLPRLRHRPRGNRAAG